MRASTSTCILAIMDDLRGPAELDTSSEDSWILDTLEEGLRTGDVTNTADGVLYVMERCDLDLNSADDFHALQNGVQMWIDDLISEGRAREVSISSELGTLFELA